MKVAVNVDCTPDEARAFLGLPDVKPMQEHLLREVQERMTESLKAMEPDAMLKTWLPATLKGLEHFQEMFVSQLAPTKSVTCERHRSVYFMSKGCLVLCAGAAAARSAQLVHPAH
jgi:Family of unknown function (DUF6489)